MINTNIPVVTIIGGGFCGMMTAVHLCKRSQLPLKIIIINDDYPFGKGVAYSAHTSKYLLNVRAINMSAFPDDKEHFLNWICKQDDYKAIGKTIMTNVYMPRKKYGEYLTSVWSEMLQNKNETVDVELISDTATDISKGPDGYTVKLKHARPIVTDFIVLATGNNKPGNIGITDEAILSGVKYFSNPWSHASVSNVQSEKNILVVGNGLTMIDTVLGLLENNFGGTIYTISTSGFSLLPHKYNLLVYENIVKELPETYTLHSLLTLVNKHAKSLTKVGIGVHLVIDALRPYTQQIWQSLSFREKKIFLKKLSYPWNALRHRVPLHIYEHIQNLRMNKKLITFSGKLIQATATEEGISAVLFDKKNKKEETIIVDRIINCTGPQSNIHECSNTLLRKLAEKRMIVPDELQLGIDADPATAAVINANGEKSNNIFTIGSNLKGVLWESVAVPELRVQAQNLAITIIDKAAGHLLASLTSLKKKFEQSYIE
ncbi:MAG TPA: FAD/NAD(P)-binding protein [Panacibacter sp.]|nr:FAD/NAD(P)-binding protein [Panacibacter sp.]